MPIYEYKCNHCGECFEQLVFSSEGQVAPRCPACDGSDTQRLMSSFACGSKEAGKGLNRDLASSCSSSGGFS